MAVEEGFGSWSLLSAKAGKHPAKALLSQLEPGDLLLIGARPLQGKTLLSVELAIEAMRQHHLAMFYSLDLTTDALGGCFTNVGAKRDSYAERFHFDGSDEISAAYIIEQSAEALRGTLIIVDYLQLLDQRRDTPPLQEQVRALRDHAAKRALIIAVIAQIDRAYDASRKPCPDVSDVRLPNAVDLNLFTKCCFLHGGEMRIHVTPAR